MPGRLVAKANQHAGVVMIALAVFGGGLYAYQLNTAAEKNDCQAAVNQAVSKNIKIRSDISRRSDDAKTDLLTSIGAMLLMTPTEDKKEQEKRTKQFLDLFRKYDAEVKAVDTARAENPIPEIEGLC